MKQNVYAIILCGGSGSRLWPRSRSSHPKHLLNLNNGGETLVQETIDRVELPLENIFCVTEASHAELLKQQVSGIPEENIIIEPDRRGTATVTAYALLSIRDRLQSDDIVISLAADHIIDRKAFKATFQPWVTAASKTKRIISLGIRPTYPSSGLGYINMGNRLGSFDHVDVFETEQFVEKPNEETAKVYLDSGKYLWNANIFAATLSVLLGEFDTHMPEMMTTLNRSMQALQSGDTAEAQKLYLGLPNETIDYGVLEKSDNLGVLPASFSWADIGSWADLHDMLEHDNDGNVFDGEYVDIDSKDCFVYSPDILVATIGLENLVIINTGDAVLICPKDRSQDVKKVVEKLKERGMKKYL